MTAKLIILIGLTSAASYCATIFSTKSDNYLDEWMYAV